MVIAWMDTGIGAGTDLRRNGSNITAKLFCLASISTIKSYSLTIQPGESTLVFLLTFAKADYI